MASYPDSWGLLSCQSFKYPEGKNQEFQGEGNSLSINHQDLSNKSLFSFFFGCFVTFLALLPAWNFQDTWKGLQKISVSLGNPKFDDSKLLNAPKNSKEKVFPSYLQHYPEERTRWKQLPTSGPEF